MVQFWSDTAYTSGTFGIGYGVGALVSLIPGVGLFAVLGGVLVSIGAMELIDWAVEEYGWLYSIKEWIESW